PARDALDEPVGDLLDDVGAFDPRAGLTRVCEAAPHAARDRVVEVGVGADDLRVLAAELEDRALESLCAELAHLPADLDRAGEEDLPRRRLAEGRADGAATVDDAHEALRQAGLLERLADPFAEQ